MPCDHSSLRRARPWRPAALLLLVLFLLLFAPPPAQAQADPPTSGRVSVARLNVRSAPSMSGAVVGKLLQGERVLITGVSDDGEWFQVEPDKVDAGWVFADYIDTGAAAAAMPTAERTAQPTAQPTKKAGAEAAATATPEPTAEPTATGAKDDTGDTGADNGGPLAVVAGARLNVRSGPGTNYPVVSSANKGARLPITGQNEAGTWYQVTVSGLNEAGWVSAGLTKVTGSLEAAPVVAAPALAAAAVGTEASKAAAPAAAPPVAPAASGGFGYGVTANLWDHDKQGALDLIKQLGFTWVKQQIRWEYAEPERGAVNWQEMDAIINAVNDNGVNIMFSVVTSPPWARPTLGGTGGPPEDFGLFANFVGSIAGRYCGRLGAIEVWNEQNLRREWEGFPLEPASYMELLKRSYNAIKAACPSLLVISGATTPAGYSDVAFDDIDYLRGMYQNGLARYSDGVGIHPSGFANPPSVRFEDWAAGNYDALSHVNHRSFYFLSTLEQSRRVMEEFGDGAKRLWPTEFGWGSTPSPFPGYEYEARISEGEQARWTVQAFETMRDSGYVAAPMLWNLNYPRDTEMGAFAIAGRPVFDALRRMMGR